MKITFLAFIAVLLSANLSAAATVCSDIFNNESQAKGSTKWRNLELEKEYYIEDAVFEVTESGKYLKIRSTESGVEGSYRFDSQNDGMKFNVLQYIKSFNGGQTMRVEVRGYFILETQIRGGEGQIKVSTKVPVFIITDFQAVGAKG